MYKTIIFKAKKQEFMHLCGVDYLNPKTKKRVNAKHFYSLVKSNKISSSFLIEKQDGTTELKLSVLQYLSEILTDNIRIIDGQVVFSNLSFNAGIRSRRDIFALALTQESYHSNVYLPQSLLNLKTAKSNALKKSYKVEGIYSNSREDGFIAFYESDEYKMYLKKTDVSLS